MDAHRTHTKHSRWLARSASSTALSMAAMLLMTTALSGCDEAKKEEPKKVEETVEEPAPPPKPKTAPRLSIDEISPMVGFSRAVLVDASGKANPRGESQLVRDLEEGKEFFTSKDVVLEVDRKAKPEWVALYLTKLGELSPSKVTIKTETRDEYPKEIVFVPEAKLGDAPQCSLVGTITSDRGTAIWRLSGGTARKRGRGMGGPDLTMTADTIISMAKKCDSDLFVVTGAEGVEWGLIYDLAASGIALEKAGLERAALPIEPPVAGNKVDLAK